MKEYQVRLTNAGVPFWGVQSRFELVPAVSRPGAAGGAGVKYAQAKVSMASLLSREDAAKAKAFSEKMAPLFGRVSVTDEDLMGESS